MLSESCTNVVRHAAAVTDVIKVTVVLSDSVICIGVHDGDPHFPAAMPAEAEAAHGRCLAIVCLFAESLGGRTFAERTPDGGKTMWVVLPHGGVRATGQPRRSCSSRWSTVAALPALATTPLRATTHTNRSL